MQNCGFEVTALDNMKDFWPAGTMNRHFYVLDGDILRPRLTRKFEMVTCISVLEHIRQSERAVASMASLLEEGGHLVLTFPYNEREYCENVYGLPGSNAPRDVAHVTQAFSRKELDRWTRENGLTILEQQYWKFFTGPFWTVGERVFPPEQVGHDDLHQIGCLLLEKPLGKDGNIR